MGKPDSICPMYEILDLMKFRRNDDPVVIALEDAGISADVARRLATAGTPLHIKPGVPLCREGDFGREAFVLVRGGAVVHYDGKQRTVAAGEVFGELAALDPKLRR